MAVAILCCGVVSCLAINAEVLLVEVALRVVACSTVALHLAGSAIATCQLLLLEVVGRKVVATVVGDVGGVVVLVVGAGGKGGLVTGGQLDAVWTTHVLTFSVVRHLRKNLD